MTDASWPANGAVPVFSGDLDDYDLVGFTTFTMSDGVRRFRMSRSLTEAEAVRYPAGPFMMNGEAVVIERQGTAGPYLAWLVVDGDPRGLPDFWPI
jgi:hypothetical protein